MSHSSTQPLPDIFNDDKAVEEKEQQSEPQPQDEASEEDSQTSEASEEDSQTSANSQRALQIATPVALVVFKPEQRALVSLEPSSRLRQQMQRYVRRSLRERRKPSLLSRASVVMLAILLFGILTPLVLAAAYGIRAYASYTAVREHASSGIQHVLNVRTVLTASTVPSPSGLASASDSVFDSARLLRAKSELVAARADFTQARDLIDDTALFQLVAQYLPQYRPQVVSARAACQIGIDATGMGEQVIDVGLQLAPRLHGPLLGNAVTPLVTAGDLALVQKTLDDVQPLVNDILLQARSLSLDALPLSTRQRDLAREYLPLLPQMAAALNTGSQMIGDIGWLLGVNSPRTFLIETMDRGELRPTGGFTGQFGELHINGGRVAPFSLQNVALVEYSNDTPVAGNQAPDAYRSWWPFANWGMRDANLSADFPTSARLIANQYKLELKHPVDGVIMFTPFLIERILRVTGPLVIPQYQETITAQNLEERLHYYQLDNNGIRKEEIVEHVEDPEQARKLFTSALARALMDRMRGASASELLSLGYEMLGAMKTRDLQVYLTNPQLEDLLMRYNYAGQMDRSSAHDGLYIVQANVSASKASQYVQTIVHDTVSLDGAGGATHVMQMRLVYNQIGPVYGLDTYRDYVRVYVPPTSRFLRGNGFDTGQPLCGGPLAACPANGIYPNDELVCPPNQYVAGASAPMLNDPYTGQYHPLDKIGPPTDLKSDEPGRSMFGGYIVVPKNCTMTVTLSWYVPSSGHDGYNLLYQRQAGTYPQVDLTILPPPAQCASFGSAGYHFNGVLTQDASFSLARAQQPSQAQCDRQPPV